MPQQPSLARLAAADPVAGASATPEHWHDELLARIAADSPSPARTGRRRPTRLALVAAVALVLLVIPSYAVAREVIEWVSGAPAPRSVVREFESYATQLGYRPKAHEAVLVAVDDGDVRLYSTRNDKGSYCLVLTAPGRPAGDGGTCIQPAWAAEPLIAGTLGATTDDGSWKQFIAGRSAHPGARSIRLSDPEGAAISRPIGFDGFFVAAVVVPEEACSAGDWRPTFVVSDASGDVVAQAEITLMFSRPLQGVCGFIPPHPPSVR